MTVADMIAKQTRIEHQDKPKAVSVSFDGQAANVFQAYIGAALGFSLQRCGLLYGECDEGTGAVLVHFIYEPPQQGRVDCVEMGDDEGQKAKADFIAAQLGFKNVRAPRVWAGGGGGGLRPGGGGVVLPAAWAQVGWIFSASAQQRDFELSEKEIRAMARMQARL